MKKLKTIFSLSLLLTSMILTGCADSTQTSTSTPSQGITTSAVTTAASVISTTSAAIRESSSVIPPVDPLSVEGQLKTIAETKDKIVTRGKYDANYHYAVTDLDQNGRLELILATEMNGTGHITHNWYYEISKDDSKLKKCKGKAFGKEGHDIYDAIMGKKKASALLKDASFVDEYRGKQIPQGKKSVTIRLTIGSAEKTLTSQEIESVAEQVMKKLGKKMGAELRTQ